MPHKNLALLSRIVLILVFKYFNDVFFPGRALILKPLLDRLFGYLFSLDSVALTPLLHEVGFLQTEVAEANWSCCNDDEPDYDVLNRK